MTNSTFSANAAGIGGAIESAGSNEIIEDTIRRLPPDAERILMVITFDVNEGDRVAWHDVWSRVRQYALEWPACSAFRLGRTHHTRGPMVVMATWDNHEELNRFVRQSNILWIDRALDYHAHYAVFEMTPAERSSHQMEPQLAAVNFME